MTGKRREAQRSNFEKSLLYIQPIGAAVTDGANARDIVSSPLIDRSASPVWRRRVLATHNA
jgi:hypothetical protein